MTKLIDCHSHSSNSPDADESVEIMCDKAVKLGLFAYGITDHFEANGYNNSYYVTSSRNSFLEIVNYRNNYKPETKILAGIEVGQPLQDVAVSNEIIGRFEYDYILASLHNLKFHTDFAFLDYEKTDVDSVIKKYFEELLEIAKWGNFNVLAHLTYPARYIFKRCGHRLNLDNYKAQIDEVLKEIIKKDIALEINTSTLRSELKFTLPQQPQVDRYVELGGKLISVGADAHNSEYIGFGIEYAYEMVKKAGLNEVCYFEKRQPRLLKI